MIRKIIVSFILLFPLFLCQASPFHDENHHPLIVDTDCAFDDIRAVSMLLSFPDIEVTGIVVTEGTLLPEEGAVKIKSLMHIFSLDTMAVACGRTMNRPGPAWRELNRSVTLGNPPQKHKVITDGVAWLMNTLETSDETVTYVCLGPLSTIAEVLQKNPALINKIYRIIWYNESINPASGFNYTYDKAAADLIINTKIRIDLISNCLLYTSDAADE